MSSERWLTTGQVARRLGYHIETIRKRCHLGEIPAHRFEGQGPWKIPKSWVDEEMRRMGAFVRKKGSGDHS